MIRRFSNKETEAIFNGLEVRDIPKTIQPGARRKLKLIDAAIRLDDLRMPPGNRLKKLGHDRKGQWSIRVNQQWRICFRWRDDHAWDVEVNKHYGD